MSHVCGCLMPNSVKSLLNEVQDKELENFYKLANTFLQPYLRTEERA
jgi:hypothetical protein